MLGDNVSEIMCALIEKWGGIYRPIRFSCQDITVDTMLHRWCKVFPRLAFTLNNALQRWINFRVRVSGS